MVGASHTNPNNSRDVLSRKNGGLQAAVCYTRFMKTVSLYTDGGARGNPGPAGAGAVLLDEKGATLKETAKYLGHQTNNNAEYEAVALGLETVKKYFGTPQCKELTVNVFLDSELVARQLSGEYQVKEAMLFPLFMRIHNMQVKDLPHVSFTHIRREKNTRADALANEAMDRGR